MLTNLPLSISATLFALLLCTKSRCGDLHKASPNLLSSCLSHVSLDPQGLLAERTHLALLFRMRKKLQPDHCFSKAFWCVARSLLYVLACK